MNNINLEKFIIGLSKVKLHCFLGEVSLKDAVNIALRSQNMKVDDDYKLTVLRDKQKFNIGDWIVRKDGTSFGLNNKYVAQIIDVTADETNDKYMYWISEDEYISDYVDDFRKWTIEDAKDGDILCTYEHGEPKIIFILKETPKKHYDLNYHCYYNIMYPYFYPCFGFESKKGCLLLNGEDAKPATKEQCDTLFEKMKEAGYRWDADEKKLINYVDEPFDDLEMALYDYLSSDTGGTLTQQQMRRCAKARAREIREKLK